eukprot:scaffold47798_cov47-Phaeocystis_antarctica.AAC.1
MRGCRGVALYIPLHPLYTPYTLSTPPYLAVDGLEAHQELLQRREELGRLLVRAVNAISAVSAVRLASQFELGRLLDVLVAEVRRQLGEARAHLGQVLLEVVL